MGGICAANQGPGGLLVDMGSCASWTQQQQHQRAGGAGRAAGPSVCGVVRTWSGSGCLLPAPHSEELSVTRSSISGVPEGMEASCGS
jgi:hypothetical protein